MGWHLTPPFNTTPSPFLPPPPHPTPMNTLHPHKAAAQDASAAAASSFRSRRKRKKEIPCEEEEEEEEEEELHAIAGADEKGEVEKKIVALQKIVPGGERFPVEELFEETAEYIYALERQVKALRFLTAFVQSSEKRKRKLGA